LKKEEKFVSYTVFYQFRDIANETIYDIVFLLFGSLIKIKKKIGFATDPRIEIQNIQKLQKFTHN
jgi:hypothetical protein